MMIKNKKMNPRWTQEKSEQIQGPNGLILGSHGFCNNNNKTRKEMRILSQWMTKMPNNKTRRLPGKEAFPFLSCSIISREVFTGEESKEITIRGWGGHSIGQSSSKQETFLFLHTFHSILDDDSLIRFVMEMEILMLMYWEGDEVDETDGDDDDDKEERN